VIWRLEEPYAPLDLGRQPHVALAKHVARACRDAELLRRRPGLDDIAEERQRGEPRLNHLPREAQQPRVERVDGRQRLTRVGARTCRGTRRVRLVRGEGRGVSD
jgi:hypothetical protein